MRRDEVIECTVRMFCVGFGDCFLLTIAYRSGRRFHVLIDFGTMRQAPGGPTPKEVAVEIAKEIGSDPWIIVATHRHRDHLSGFQGASWNVLNRLRAQVRKVLQPWTEHPRLARDAVGPSYPHTDSGFARSLRLGKLRIASARAFLKAHRGELAPSVADELEFVAGDNLPNIQAIRNLASFGKRCLYLEAHDTRVTNLIPGVSLHVLGPPTTRHWARIRTQAQRHDEFWHLRAITNATGTTSRKVRPPLAERERRDRASAASAWFRNRVRQALAHEYLSIVRALDHAMNNTSLILLFQIGDAALLFPGDAQIENWSYALSQPKLARLLAGVTFYKVGHHGSLNATPKSLWNQFAHRSDQKQRRPMQLLTTLSTLSGVHGSFERGTEVPRTKLVRALKSGSVLRRTDESTKQVHVIDIPVRRQPASKRRRRKR